MDLVELVGLIDSGQHGVPFDVKVEGDELSRLANDRLTGLASDVSVEITAEQVVVGAKARVVSMTMDLLLKGKPVLEDGRLRFDIASLDLNNRPAPGFMSSQIANAINEKLDPAELPVTFSRLVLREGWIEAAGETR